MPARRRRHERSGDAEQKVNSDLGFFVQDTWTINKLTLNIGGRFDLFNAEVPAQSRAPLWPAVTPRTGAGAANFAAIPNVPNWNDWAVRFAGAYDLFGNGKTAIKANASKYIAAAAAGYAQNFNPMSYCGSCAVRRAPGSTSTATSRSSMRPATSSSTKSSAARRTSGRSPTGLIRI